MASGLIHPVTVMLRPEPRPVRVSGLAPFDPGALLLTAALQGRGVLAGEMAVINPVALGAAIVCGGRLLAALSVADVVPLSASFTAQATLAAPLTVAVSLNASLTGRGTVMAEMTQSVALAASIAGTASLAAGMAQSVALSAAFTGAGTLSATLAQGAGLSASFAGTGALAASMSQSVAFAAGLTGAGTLVAIMRQDISLASSMVGRGLVASTMTVTAGAAVFTDDFNRANESLGSSPNWTRVDGQASALTVDSNMLASATTAETTYLSPDLGSANHYVEATLRLVGANGPFLLCRATNLNNWLGVRNSASVYQTFKRVNGTLTQLTSASPTPAVGDRIRLQVNGDAGSLTINGVEVAGSPFQLLGDLAGVTRQGVIARTSIRNPWIDDYKAGVL